MTPHELSQIQNLLHDLIRVRAAKLTGSVASELPSLTSDTLADHKRQWFPVAGMYGGFAYWLKSDAAQPTLVVESWSRVIDGSGARHEITVDGCTLVGEGFV